MPKSAAAFLAGSKSWRSQPSSLAAALVGTERSNAASNDATPELDRARATAFADTVDALYAVIAEQRQGAARLSRRMSLLLAFIGCVLAVTMAAGIAQTVALQRMNRGNTRSNNGSKNCCWTSRPPWHLSSIPIPPMSLSRTRSRLPAIRRGNTPPGMLESCIRALRAIRSSVAADPYQSEVLRFRSWARGRR